MLCRRRRRSCDWRLRVGANQVRSCRKHLAHGEGFGPEAEHADNNSGLRGRLNDRHPLRDFHDGPGIHAHRKAEYTNATAPLPDSKINRGTYRLTEESIYELLGGGYCDL